MTYRLVVISLALAAAPLLAYADATVPAPAPPVNPPVPPTKTVPAPVPEIRGPELSPSARPGGTNSPYNVASPPDSTPFSGMAQDPATGMSGRQSLNPPPGNGNAPGLQPGAPKLAR